MYDANGVCLGGEFIPPVRMNKGDMILWLGKDSGHRAAIYRGEPDGTWALETVYTFQDGAWRIIIEGSTDDITRQKELE